MRTPDQLWSDPANWKWGLLYRAAADPRLIVKKRDGLGWTLNFASPRAYLLLGANVIVGIGLSVLIARSA